MPADVPGRPAPEEPPAGPPDPFAEYVLANVDSLDENPMLTENGVSLFTGVGPTCDYDWDYFVVSRGMSDRAMNVPAGGEAYRYAELVLFNRGGAAHLDEWVESYGRWMFDWMFRIAAMPFDNGTWIGGKWTVIPNGEPPRPLTKGTKMTCWLLLAEKEPLRRVELPDGKSVVFYTMIPIHTAERDLIDSDGLEALLARFEKRKVSTHIKQTRRSVV